MGSSIFTMNPPFPAARDICPPGLTHTPSTRAAGQAAQLLGDFWCHSRAVSRANTPARGG